jgi:hypothetical protein
VFIDDIAAQLSRICRFGGALKKHAVCASGALENLEIYSVAQHSVLVADNVPEPYRLRALLHDAAEAYIGDRIKPVKMGMTLDRRALLDFLQDEVGIATFHRERIAEAIAVHVPCFKRLEVGVQRAILARFGLPEVDEEADAAIAVADYRAVLTERRDLLPANAAVDWGTPTEEPFPERVISLLPSAARALFLQRFNELYKGG